MPFIVTRRKPVIKLSTHELCRPLPCWNNSILYLEKCHQVSCKNGLTQFSPNTKLPSEQAYELSLATKERLRNDHSFIFPSSPPSSGALMYAAHESKRNTELQ